MENSEFKLKLFQGILISQDAESGMISVSDLLNLW